MWYAAKYFNAFTETIGLTIFIIFNIKKRQKVESYESLKKENF
jgi:hypothetical protein